MSDKASLLAFMSQDSELDMACEYSNYLADDDDDDDRALYALWATLEDERARREAAKSGGSKPATPPASKRTASPSTASSVRRVAPLLSSDGASVARGLCGQFTCATASAVQGGGGEASSLRLTSVGRAEPATTPLPY